MKLKKSTWHTVTAIMDIDKKGKVRLTVDSGVQQQPRSEMVIDDWVILEREINRLTLSLFGLGIGWPNSVILPYRDCESLALQSFFELGWRE